METKQQTRRLRRYQVYVADESGRIIPNGYIGHIEGWDLTAERAIRARLVVDESRGDRIRKIKGVMPNTFRVSFIGSGSCNYVASIVR